MSRRQSREEKAAAVASLLPLLHLHLDLIVGVRSSLGNLAPSLEEEWRPPTPTCAGDCPSCRKAHARAGVRPICPPDEAWVQRERYFRSRYRLAAIARGLERLHARRPLLALAAYYHHVEPWPEWNANRRPALAREACHLIAEEIRGELVPFAPAATQRRPVADRLDEVRRLHDRGLGRNQIVGELRMSARDVTRLLDEIKRKGIA